MADGRRKPHYTHEINDAYAEGWDARRKWPRGAPPPPNPYVAPTRIRKPPDDRKAAQQRDLVGWQEGWNDCEEDLRKDDLTEVRPADFRKNLRYPVRRRADDEES